MMVGGMTGWPTNHFSYGAPVQYSLGKCGQPLSWLRQEPACLTVAAMCINWWAASWIATGSSNMPAPTGILADGACDLAAGVPYLSC